MLFCNKPNPLPSSHSNFNCNILLNSIILNQVNVSKFLEVFIDDKLNWKQHMSILLVNSKISRNLGIIRKVHYKLPLSTLLSLYYALIAPKCLIVILFGLLRMKVIRSVYLNLKRKLLD